MTTLHYIRPPNQTADISYNEQSIAHSHSNHATEKINPNQNKNAKLISDLRNNAKDNQEVHTENYKTERILLNEDLKWIMRITEVQNKDLHIVKSNLSWIIELYDKLYKSNFTDKFKRFMKYHDTNWNINYLHRS